MQIRHYIPSDAPAVLQLWDTAGVRAGYAPQDEAGLCALLLAHSDFSAAHTFVLDVDGRRRASSMAAQARIWRRARYAAMSAACC